MTAPSVPSSAPVNVPHLILAHPKLIGTSLIALAATFGGWGKYWYEQGKVAGETETTKVLQEKINDQATSISGLTASVAVQTDRAQRASEDLKKATDEISKLNAMIVETERSMAVFDARAKGADSCAFVRQKIDLLQQQINRATMPSRNNIFVANQESSAEAVERQRRNDAETAPMRQQLLAFTERLKECTQTPR